MSTTEEIILSTNEESTSSKFTSSTFKIDLLELPPYKMTEREINAMKPFTLDTKTELVKAPSETPRMYVMRDYISFMTITNNPTYQLDSFVAKTLAELMYNVQY